MNVFEKICVVGIGAVVGAIAMDLYHGKKENRDIFGVWEVDDNDSVSNDFEKPYSDMINHFKTWGPGFLKDHGSQYITKFLGNTIDVLMYQRSEGDETNKDLWFLLDETAERRMVWMERAVSAAIVHEIPFNGVFTWMRECKKRLEHDQKNGIDTMLAIGKWYELGNYR